VGFSSPRLASSARCNETEFGDFNGAQRHSNLVTGLENPIINGKIEALEGEANMKIQAENAWKTQCIRFGSSMFEGRNIDFSEGFLGIPG